MAPGPELARRLARDLALRLPRARFEAFSLAGYLAADSPPSRVVLGPAGRSAAGDLAFLTRASRRLLWPAPPPRFRRAIGGLRNTEEPARPVRSRPLGTRSRTGVAAALLLEGEVDPERARAALAAAGPLAWIVEAPGRVRIADRSLEVFGRAGVRWFVLEPVSIVAVFATPALARSKKGRRALLPARAPFWIRR